MSAFGVLHPLLVHFPVALVVTALLLEVRSWRRDRTVASPHTFPLLTFAALTAVAAAGTGWLHAWDGPWETGQNATTLFRHRWLGIGTALTTVGAVWLFRGAPQGGKLRAARTTLCIAAALVMTGGHFGAELTHGRETYLRALDQILGRSSADEDPFAARKEWAARALAAWSAPESGAPTYVEHIQPILVGRCLGCHGPERKRGGLRLDSLARVREGGDLGAALVAGYRASSGIWIRTARGNEEHPQMPKDEDPLPPEWIEALGDWIDAGAAWPDVEPTPWIEEN